MFMGVANSMIQKKNVWFVSITILEGRMKKYKQPHNLREYDPEVRDRVHNALKHGMPLDRWDKWYKSKWSKRLCDEKSR